MKITAEFNSVDEVLAFANTFGVRGLTTGQVVNQVVGVLEPKETIQESKVKKDKKEAKKETPKEEIPKVDAEVVGVEEKAIEIKDIEEVKEEAPKTEEPKVTKEMVRERIGSIMKAGKQKEAKELVAKYGADKLPNLKEEHYAAIYKDAEELL